MITINKHPSPRELRLFAGLWLPGFGLLFGALSYWRGDQAIACWVWGATAAASLAGLASRGIARATFLGLSYLTFPIGFCLSYLVLSSIFLLVVTPIGLFMRAIGRDPLRLRRPAGATTYWVARDPAADRVDRQFRQF